MSFRIAVLVSGEGSNLQALIDELADAPIEIVGRRLQQAGGARAGAGAGGGRRRVLARGRAGPREARRGLAGWLEEREVDLVVLAGFMELLTPTFIRRFAGRIVNITRRCCRPSPVSRDRQALEYGVKVAGVTVHFVDEGMDSGPIILQEALELPYHRDIAADRAATLHEVEHGCCRRRCG